MKESDFYSLNKILSKKATYNVIFGERSNGKTYATLKYGVEKFLKTRKQIALVRRWKEDVIGKRARQIFANLVSNGEVKKLSKGLYTGITYFAGRFYLCTYDEENRPLYNMEQDCLAFTFALSDMEHDKSLAFPDVETIIFDEFISKGQYLEDEFVTFMNVVSTIVRHRTNVEIFMLGNTVNRFCPYFKEMGLTHISEMKQGTIDVYTYGDSSLTVAVEYCSSINRQKENGFYFAFNNPKLHMITSGAWELDIYPHLPKKYTPKDVLFTYFIEFNGACFQCEIIMLSDNELFTYIHEKTTPIKNTDTDLVYSLEYSAKMNYNRNVLKPINTIQKKISWFFATDKVFYQNNEVGDSISNYLHICKGV